MLRASLDAGDRLYDRFDALPGWGLRLVDMQMTLWCSLVFLFVDSLRWSIIMSIGAIFPSVRFPTATAQQVPHRAGGSKFTCILLPELLVRILTRPNVLVPPTSTDHNVTQN